MEQKIISLFRYNSIVDLCYWYTPRLIFEAVYMHKEELRQYLPDIIDELCNAKSQNEFMKVLYDHDVKGKNISVQLIDNKYCLI